jgi:hypothetical protein
VSLIDPKRSLVNDRFRHQTLDRFNRPLGVSEELKLAVKTAALIHGHPNP